MNADALFSPPTEANQRLRAELAPSDWTNPTPVSITLRKLARLPSEGRRTSRARIRCMHVNWIE